MPTICPLLKFPTFDWTGNLTLKIIHGSSIHNHDDKKLVIHNTEVVMSVSEWGGWWRCIYTWLAWVKMNGFHSRWETGCEYHVAKKKNQKKEKVTHIACQVDGASGKYPWPKIKRRSRVQNYWISGWWQKPKISLWFHLRAAGEVDSLETPPPWHATIISLTPKEGLRETCFCGT